VASRPTSSSSTRRAEGPGRPGVVSQVGCSFPFFPHEQPGHERRGPVESFRTG
jgi:hypothetical protein